MKFDFHFKVTSESLKMLGSDPTVQQRYIANCGPWIENDVFDFEILDWLPGLEHNGLISTNLFSEIKDLYKEIEEFTLHLSDEEEKQLICGDIEPMCSWRAKAQLLNSRIEADWKKYKIS